MTMLIETYEKKEWSAEAFDLDNGSAYVSFYDADGEKFAEVYCDDYDHGDSDTWERLDREINELPDRIEVTKEELSHWENGMGSNPLDEEYFTND